MQRYDHLLIQAARVEAALTRSQPCPVGIETQLSLEYLELNSTEPD